MAQRCRLQNPLTCFRLCVYLCDAHVLPSRCSRACGMAETEWSWLPVGISSQPVAYWRDKARQIPISRVPWNFTKMDMSVFLQRRGCLAQWSRSEGPHHPVPVLPFICFVIWAMSLPCSGPPSGQVISIWSLPALASYTSGLSLLEDKS